MGLDSLLAAELCCRLKLDSYDLLDQESVLSIVDLLLNQQEPARRADLPAVSEQGAESWLPVSEGQKALWVLEQQCEDGSALNITRALRLSGPFAPQAFRSAVVRLVERHESLRTIFFLELNHKSILPRAGPKT